MYHEYFIYYLYFLFINAQFKNVVLYNMETNEQFINKTTRKNYQNINTRNLYNDSVLCNLTI